jgi:TolB-like protein/Tfp pilus assembly protein PilF
LSQAVPPLRTIRPEIPGYVDAAILRALAKSPAARFATAAEFLAALSRPTPPRPFWRSRWLLLAAIALLLIGGAALLARKLWRSWARPGTRIAVLPYEIRGLPTDSSFADGLADALTSSLAGIHGITVIGRQSMLRYRNSVKSAAEIGKELGVAYLLGGTLTWTRDNPPPDSIRITSSLQRTTDGGVVWTRTDNRPAADLFAVQAGITEDVAARLKISLGRDEQRALRTPLTANTAAYQEYLLGRSQLLLRTGARLENAIDHFGRAIALDSSFAEAYVGLGNSWIGYPNFWNRIDSTRNLVSSAVEAYRRAGIALHHALSLDSTLTEARSQLAILDFHGSLDAQRAARELAAVIARDPNSTSAHQGLRSAYVAQGRIAQALVESRKTVELDPLSPLANTYLGVDLVASGRIAEAMQALRTAIEVGPGFSAAYMILGTLQLQNGQPAAGADTVRRFLELRGYPPADDSVVAAALAGRGSVAAALTVLDRFARTGWEPELRIAGLYALLGAGPRALDVLEEAKRRRMWELTVQRYQPFFATLQNEPRFKALWALENR